MTVPTPLTPTAHAEHSPAARTPAEHPSAAHRGGWWRANRLALVALLVLVPLIGVGVWWNEWYAYYGYGARKVTAVQAPKDGTLDLGGATWGPLKSGEAKDTSGLDLPAGTRLLIAVLPVRPDGRAVACESPLLVHQSSGREWAPVRSEVGIPSSPDEPERCISDLADPDDPASARPYSITVGYVVPDDVEGPFWLDVDPLGDERFARFSVEP